VNGNLIIFDYQNQFVAILNLSNMKNPTFAKKLTRDEMKLISGGKLPADCANDCFASAPGQCAFEGGGGNSNGNYETCYYSVLQSCILGCIGY
jgi:hypothetical protein